MRFYLLISGVVALIAAWVAADWYRARDQALSEPPPRQSGEIALEPRDSVILANFEVPYPVLQKALNEVGHALNDTQRGSRRIASVLGQDIDVRWDIEHGLDGTIAVGHDRGKLKVTLPGKFDGSVGVLGDVSRTLDLDDKAVDGKFVVTASAGIEIGEDFCPKITPGQVSFRWTQPPRIQIVGRTRILGLTIGPYDFEFGGFVEDEIRDALNRALQQQRDAIPCAPVRDELEKIWTLHSFPIDIPDMPQLYFHLEPRSLAASDLLVEPEGLRMVVRLRAGAFVSDEPASGERLGKLPKNQGSAADRGEIQLAVPLALGYETIRTAALVAFENQPLTFETEAGEVTVDVGGFTIYPSGERIAIGVEFSADLPWRIFDANGTLWLTARPEVTRGGDAVSFREIAVTRQTDNTLLNVLTVAFAEQIRAELEASSTVDLSGQKAEAIAAIDEAVAKAGAAGGIDLVLEDPDIRLAEVIVGADRLVVEAMFSAFVDTSLREIQF